MRSFTKILDLCLELRHGYPDVVFIGGVAVYVHLAHQALSIVPLEASHDADFMISISDYGSLKDEEEITYTPRSAKHQMIVDEIEFDIYVEKLNHLVVPYDDVYAASSVLEQIRVASLEHLLVLKLEAYGHRGHSSKGEKDSRDLIKIGLMLGRDIKNELILPYWRDEYDRALLEISKSTIFFGLCQRNAHAAKQMRASFEDFVETIGS
jgi:hypothetical protein